MGVRVIEKHCIRYEVICTSCGDYLGEGCSQAEARDLFRAHVDPCTEGVTVGDLRADLKRAAVRG